MGLPVDTSTVLLLAAPLFLPKLYKLVGQSVANFSQKTQPRLAASRNQQQAKPSQRRPLFTSSGIPALLLALYSAYSIVLGRPFNFFISLGHVPVTAPASKIQAALAWRGLADKYGEDLALLTSLDMRALYMHFGHANLVGCYRLLGTAAPKDVLIYASIQLARSYIIRVVALAYSNRRWKNTILLASFVGFLCEVYRLATTDMRLPNQPNAIRSLYDFLTFCRNVGFLCAAFITLLLPSKVPAKPLSPEETALLQGVHELIQRQDLIQTRIRVVEAAIHARVKKEFPSAPSHLSTTQQESLKTWLRTITDPDASKSRAQPTINIDDSLERTVILPVKAEQMEQTENCLRVPKTESLDFVDQTFATAPVVMRQSSSEESPSSPSLSRSSSSSTPIDTPTPAMRRPMSMEITAAASAELSDLMKRNDNDAVEDEDMDVDQPLNKRISFTNRLTQSLGPSSLVTQSIKPILQYEEMRQHRRSSSMYHMVPDRSDTEIDFGLIGGNNEGDSDQANRSTTETVGGGSLHCVESPVAASHEADGSRMLSLEEALHLSENDIASSQRTETDQSAVETGPSKKVEDEIELVDENKTFNNRLQDHTIGFEEEGWTTVLSKKAKYRT